MHQCQEFCISHLHFTPFSTHPGGGGSKRAGGREIHVNSPSTFLWKLPPQKPKFKDVCVLFKYSHFASECWKCILRGSDFKIFPETGAFVASFFILHLLQTFATYLKSCGKPWLGGKGFTK